MSELKRRDLLKAIASGTVVSPALVCGPLPPQAAQGAVGSGKNPFRPVTKVEPVKGVPTFTIDGQPWMQPVYECFSARPAFYEDFAKAGTRVHVVTTNNGLDPYRRSKATRPDENTWDFSEFDEHARRVVNSRPDSLVLPRVYVDTPKWWLAQNPDEMELYDDGKPTTEGRGYWAPGPFPSIVSEKWRKDMGEGLARVLEHIHSSDLAGRIFGYILVGMRTEEWYQWTLGAPKRHGYGRPTVAAFRKWLQRKYGTVDALRAAWRNPAVDFENAATPAKTEREDQNQGTFRDPARSMNVIDFLLFWNDIMPDTIDYYASIVKRATRGTKVCGAFFAYLYEHRDPEGGQNALAKYNESRNLDFVFVTAGYRDRQFATGGDYVRAPHTSVALHNKLWYHDNDTTSYVTGEIQRARMAKERGGTPSQISDEELKKAMQWAYSSYGHTDTPQHSIWMQRRSAGFALCHGMFESFFDLQPGWYNSPEMMAEVARLNRMFEGSAKHDRSSNAEVLVVACDQSPVYHTYRSVLLDHSILTPQSRFKKIGAPVDQILIDDLAIAPMERYKLVIFLNTFVLSARQRQLIDKRVKNRGRTVMWCYAPGLFDGANAAPQSMTALIGIELALSPQETFIAPQIELSESGGTLGAALRKAGLKQMGFEKPCARLISVDDPEATAVGTLPGTAKPTLALKKMGSWTSVYAIIPDLPPPFYRELARQAGVHVWNERDDTFYACRSYVSLHANGAGERTIRFPRACTVWDAITEQQLAAKTRQYSYDFKNGETIILRWS